MHFDIFSIFYFFSLFRFYCVLLCMLGNMQRRIVERSGEVGESSDIRNMA